MYSLRAFAILVFALFASAPVSAQESADFYQDNKIRWIVPYRPGGAFDAYSRLLAPFVEKYTGVQVEIVNMRGAGGMKGSVEIFRAPADGLHMGIVNAPSLVGREIVHGDSVDYRMADFSFVGRIATEERVMVIKADGPLAGKSADEIAKAEIKVGATGIGGSSFLDAYVASRLLEAPWRLISGFDSSTDLRLALLRGDIDAMWTSSSSSRASIVAGDTIPVLRSGALDVATLADVPVMRSVMQNDNDLLQVWQTLTQLGRPVVAPPGIPEERLVFLRDAISRAVSDPQFVALSIDAERPVDYLDASSVLTLVRSTLNADDATRQMLTQALGGAP